MVRLRGAIGGLAGPPDGPGPQCRHSPAISTTWALGRKPARPAAPARADATLSDTASPTAPQRSQIRNMTTPPAE